MQKSKSFTNPIIGQFEFIITPISLWFQGDQHSPDIRLYIEKGMQIIGKVNEKVVAPAKKSNDKKFFFKTEPLNKKSFRVYNQGNLIYQWSLYGIQDDGNQTYLDSLQFSIAKAWSQYSNWYQNKINEFGSQIRDKDNQRIAQKWKQLKKTAEHKQYKYTLLLEKRKIQIEFILQIRCQYDNILEEYEREKQRKFREKQERMFMRSTLMPAKMSSDTRADLFKTEYNFIRSDSNDFKKQSKVPNIKIQTTQGSTHHVSFSKEDKNIEDGGKKKTKIANKPSDQSSDMLKNQSKILSEIKQQNQVGNSNQTKKTPPKQIDLNQQDMPLIRVDSNTEKLNQKNKPQTQIADIAVKRQKVTTPKAKKTQTTQPTDTVKSSQDIQLTSVLMYVVISAIMIFLVYQLMQPSSRA